MADDENDGTYMAYDDAKKKKKEKKPKKSKSKEPKPEVDDDERSTHSAPRKWLNSIGNSVGTFGRKKKDPDNAEDAEQQALMKQEKQEQKDEQARLKAEAKAAREEERAREKEERAKEKEAKRQERVAKASATRKKEKAESDKLLGEDGRPVDWEGEEQQGGGGMCDSSGPCGEKCPWKDKEKCPLGVACPWRPRSNKCWALLLALLLFLGGIIGWSATTGKGGGDELMNEGAGGKVHPGYKDGKKRKGNTHDEFFCDTKIFVTFNEFPNEEQSNAIKGLVADIMDVKGPQIAEFSVTERHRRRRLLSYSTRIELIANTNSPKEASDMADRTNKRLEDTNSFCVSLERATGLEAEGCEARSDSVRVPVTDDVTENDDDDDDSVSNGDNNDGNNNNNGDNWSSGVPTGYIPGVDDSEKGKNKDGEQSEAQAQEYGDQTAQEGDGQQYDENGAVIAGTGGEYHADDPDIYYCEDADKNVAKNTGDSCAELASEGHCKYVFCPTCPYGGKCDRSCGFCPTPAPTPLPTAEPTRNSAAPSPPPSIVPTPYPTPKTWIPTPQPTADMPTPYPTPKTWIPTPQPTADMPTPQPTPKTRNPTPQPTIDTPSPYPTPKTWIPTPQPTIDMPTPQPTPKTWNPTPQPTIDTPSPYPTPKTWIPTPQPTSSTKSPSPQPTLVPSLNPTEPWEHAYGATADGQDCLATCEDNCDNFWYKDCASACPKDVFDRINEVVCPVKPTAQPTVFPTSAPTEPWEHAYGATTDGQDCLATCEDNCDNFWYKDCASTCPKDVFKRINEVVCPVRPTRVPVPAPTIATVGPTSKPSPRPTLLPTSNPTQVWEDPKGAVEGQDCLASCKGDCENFWYEDCASTCPKDVFKRINEVVCPVRPTAQPYPLPTAQPTKRPVPAPTIATVGPTSKPSPRPTLLPTSNPTNVWEDPKGGAKGHDCLATCKDDCENFWYKDCAKTCPKDVFKRINEVVCPVRPTPQPYPMPTAQPTKRPVPAPTIATSAPIPKPTLVPRPVPTRSPTRRPVPAPTISSPAPIPNPTPAPIPLPNPQPTPAPIPHPTPFCEDNNAKVYKATGDTCMHFASMREGNCGAVFCPECPYAHFCDVSCGFCTDELGEFRPRPNMPHH